MNTPEPAPGIVFGPVPSRRLGRSLGVDLVPWKTCSYDCIYCQLGRTTCRTIERKEWVPMETILDEVKRRLAERPDYLTLGGSGEPTLHSRLGEIIERLRACTRIPIAVLTNGSLLWQEDVRREVALADVVLPSLCAPDTERFEFIHRPHPGISFERVLSGLEAFREVFRGQYWLEVMLLAGYTAFEEPVRQIARLVARIRPDKVQLNTPDRPPAEDYAMAARRDRLLTLARLFDPPAEVIAEDAPMCPGHRTEASGAAVLNLLRRRPCTLEDVVRVIRCHRPQAAKLLSRLEAVGCVRRRSHGGRTYYRAERRETPVPPAPTPE